MDINMLMKLLTGGSGSEDEDLGEVIELKTDEDLDKELEKAGDKVVVIDSFAQWCMPCKMVAPAFVELSSKYAGSVVFLRYDVDALQGTAGRLGIRAMPTFTFFKNKEQVTQFSGADPVQLEKNLVELGGVADPDFEKKKLEKQQEEHKKRKEANLSSAPEGHGNIVEVESKEHMKQLLADNKFVVAKWTADWCGPCKMAQPHLVKLSKEREDIKFVEVDTEAPGMDDVCDQCNIRALPTFCIFRDGIKVDVVTGANIPMLKKMINTVAGKK